MKRNLGDTSNIEKVFIQDGSATDGSGLAGLTSASAGLIISTIASNEATPTVYTQAAGNIETIATLGTYAAPTASKCRFKEIDSTNHPGLYEIQLANARYAVSSSNELIVTISGAADVAPTNLKIQLTVDGVNVIQYGGGAGTFSAGTPRVYLHPTLSDDTMASAIWEAALAGYGSSADYGTAVQQLLQGMEQSAWMNYHYYVRLNYVSGLPVADITGFTITMSSTGMFNDLQDIDVGSIDANGAWTPGADQGSDLWGYPMHISLTGTVNTQLDDDVIFDLQVGADGAAWNTIMRINFRGLGVSCASEGYLMLDGGLWYPADNYNFPNKVNTDRGTDFHDLVSTDVQDLKASLVVDVGAISGDSAAADRLELFSEYQSYPGRRVHFSTVDGAAGTTDHENGTLLNPSSVWADAISIAASLNLSGYHMYPGSSITLTQDHANNVLCGESWIIAPAGYDLSNSYVYDAFVDGGESTSDTQNANFVRCILWGHTIGSSVLRECAIANDLTLAENNGSYTLWDCKEAGGLTQAAVDFNAAGNNIFNILGFVGVIEIKNMAAGDVLNYYGAGGIIINANCSGGTINRLAGNLDVTDNASGAVTITNEVGRFGTDQQVPADVTAISGDTDAADNLELQYDGTGLLGDNFPATQVQLATIGGGVTLGQAAESKSLTDGAATNDYDATAVHDGTLYTVTDDDNSDPGIDTYLQYDIADNQAVSHLHMHGWFQDGSAPFTNTCLVQAYNWGTTAWETLETLSHATAEQEHEPQLLARHKSTTSNGPAGDAGVIRIRYVMAAQDGGAGSTINLDHVTVQYVNPAITAADVWAYIMTEIAVSTDPGATPTAAQALMLEYMKSRNQHDASETEEAIYNNAGAKILERDLTDIAGTVSASKVRNPT